MLSGFSVGEASCLRSMLDRLLEEELGDLEVSLEVVGRRRVPLGDKRGHVLDLDPLVPLARLLVAELIVHHVECFVVGGRLVVRGSVAALQQQLG